MQFKNAQVTIVWKHSYQRKFLKVDVVIHATTLPADLQSSVPPLPACILECVDTTALLQIACPLASEKTTSLSRHMSL